MTPLDPDIETIPIGPGVIHPDLLPGNVWGSNLRGILTRQEWDRLRIPVAEAANGRCEVCNEHSLHEGQRRRPDCHELWRFESTGDSKVQRLIRLIALCVDCHRVQHIGLAQVQDKTQEVRDQLKKVNSWTDREVDVSFENAGQRFQWRRQYDWDLDLTHLQGQIRIEAHPSLLIPADDRASLGSSYRPR